MTVYIEGIGKITASKSALNTLALIAHEAAFSYNKRGLHALADEANRATCTIYNELNAKGHYK